MSTNTGAHSVSFLQTIFIIRKTLIINIIEATQKEHLLLIIAKTYQKFLFEKLLVFKKADL